MKFSDFIEMFNSLDKSEIEDFAENENLTPDDKLLILTFSASIYGQYKKSIDLSKKMIQSTDAKYQYIGKIILIRGLVVTYQRSDIENLLNEASNIYGSKMFEIDDYISFFKAYWHNYEGVKISLNSWDTIAAIPYFEIFLNRMKEYNFGKGISAAASNLKGLYDEIGEFEKGQNLLEVMCEYIEKNPKDQLQRFYYLYNKIVSIILIQGKSDDLPLLFDEWEQLLENFSNYERLSYLAVKSFYHYQIGERNEIEFLVDRCKEIAAHEKNKFYLGYARLVEAMYLMMSSRAKHQGKAQEILENIVYSDPLESALTLWGMHFLLITLFKELTGSGDLQIIEEIQFLIDKLSSHANTTRNLFSMILVEVMRAKIAILHGDFDSYMKYFETAEELLVGRETKFFKKFILDAKFSIEEDIEKLKDMINDGISIKEQLRKLNYSRYLDDALKYVLTS